MPFIVKYTGDDDELYAGPFSDSSAAYAYASDRADQRRQSLGDDWTLDADPPASHNEGCGMVLVHHVDADEDAADEAFVWEVHPIGLDPFWHPGKPE